MNIPVTGGAINPTTTAAQITHSGGLTLTSGSMVVKLQSFLVDTTGSAPIITGLVGANGKLVGHITLVDLTQPRDFKLPVCEDAGTVTIPNIDVKLNTGAAEPLNSAFGVSAFTGELEVGSGYLLTINLPEPR